MRNLIILILIAAVAGLGYYIYQDQQDDGSVSIKVGKDGISIKTD